ncbi:MAG TPA: maleylpyruvate isomerase N-terminal domain-containing protein [Candidatus Limnocylindrales bacterium]
MDKTELIRAMRDAHETIAAAVAALTDDALHAAAPGMPGWTRKDVLAHLEYWHRNSIAVLAGVRSGVDPNPDTGEPFDIDALNARVLAESRDRSGADVREGEAASYKLLLEAVEAASHRELFEPGVVPWLGTQTASDVVAGDTYKHYPEHVPHLAAD